MKTWAAVLVETSKPLELLQLEIPRLRPGQALVDIVFSGVCRTQLLESRGKRGPDPYLPHCLGHEGAGIVVDVGPQVTRCQPGDAVILSWIKANGADIPGTVYDSPLGAVNAGGVTTFSQQAVISENRATVLDAMPPMNLAALIGCAAPTGTGAVWNTANVGSGDSIAVFGAGGVGLCAVAAAQQAGAQPVIAVDVVDERLHRAQALGADVCINAGQVDPVARIRELCPNGLDHAIEASGLLPVMQQALASVRARGGQAVVLGNAAFGDMLELDPRELNQGKRLLGSWGGDCRPDVDFPKIAQLLDAGEISLDPLLERVYSLRQVNEAIDDLALGVAARPLIDMRLPI